ncbi:MAG: type II and III secretion system protein family protein [Devosia sp.]
MTNLFPTTLRHRTAGLLIVPLLAMGLLTSVGATATLAEETHITIAAAAYGATRPVQIEVNKTALIDLPAGAAEVIVSQPGVAAAIMRTRTRAIVQGVTGGDTNIFFLDDQGRTIAVLDLVVTEPESGMGRALEQALSRVIPGSQIRVEAMTGSNTDNTTHFLLTGTVLTAEDKTIAEQLASDISGGEPRGSLIQVIGPKQVMLQVTVSEVKRDVAKQFGINLASVFNVGISNVFNIANVMIDGDIPHGADARFGPANGNHIDAGIRALEQNGALRILAQPTLTAISGQEAKFLAGGELPYYTFDDNDDGGTTRTVLFKPYGVELAFTPVVKSNGIIALQVQTSVSEPQADFSITKREASTSVELPAGTTLAIGGLLEEKSTQQIEQFPWLGDIPILGALFRSRDFQTEQTELVILVTPYLVAPSPANSIPLPTDKSAVASDAEGIFLGKLETMYGVGNSGEMRGGFSGSVGFVLD